MVLLEGDERLRRVSSPVVGLDADEVRRATEALAWFRRTHGFGRALAAPQVGVLRRFIAIDLGAGPFVVVNPEIVWRSPEQFELWDDCFSVPDKLVRVRRHVSISLTFRDAQLRERRWEGLPRDLSELLQHEIDHLDGVLMTDRAVGDDAIRPLSERAALVDAARPQHRLSLERIRGAADLIEPVFRDTPQFESAAISETLGCRLTLKVETVNPIRSFKGRGSDRFVDAFARRGAAGRLVCASAGNFGQGMAYACRARGIPLTVFAATGASATKIRRMRALGAEVRLEGADLDEAKDAARRWAATVAATFVEDGAEPEIAEGAGSIGVELLRRGDAFDAVVLPLGNGALLTGVGRWIKAASPMTGVIGVCSRGAPAMAESWRAGGPVTSARVDTIADGIAVRVPVPQALADMHGLVDDVLLVDDADLLRAMRLLHADEGLVGEPAGVAGLAAILMAPERFAGQRVATVLCGGNVDASLASTASAS